MKKTFILLTLMLVALGAGAALAAETKVVTLMTHDSFSVGKEVIKAFEKANGAKLKVLKSDDTGIALSQAILAKNNPLADVFFGVDNTYLSRALKADIFVPYRSPKLVSIPDALKLDPSNRLLPVDFGDVCLNYDKAWFAKKKMAPPKDLDDLIKPEYKSLTVVQNPATSSPGLAFLFTTIGRYGQDGYLDYWKKLRANDVYISKGWSDAYYGQFTRAKGGTRPIVMSYASSPPVEVYFSKTKVTEAPTAAVLAPKAAFRQIEFIGILKGCKEPELAKKLVDFMLSRTFQESIPTHMWVFPAVKGTPLPEVFTKYTRIVEDPVTLTPESIDANREKWIEAWTDTVLR